MAEAGESNRPEPQLTPEFIEQQTGFTLAMTFTEFARNNGFVSPDLHEERERLSAQLGEANVLPSFFIEDGVVQLGLFFRGLAPGHALVELPAGSEIKDDEDRLIREGEATFAALSPEQQAKITRPGNELLEHMQEPGTVEGVMEEIDRVFRGDSAPYDTQPTATKDAVDKAWKELAEEFYPPSPDALLPETLDKLKQAGIALEQPAQMRSFESLEDFKRDINNFHIHFTVTGKAATEMYHGRRVYKRFALLYPDATHAMKAVFEGQDFEQFDTGMWQILYESYVYMAQLVDRNDSNVMRDGKVDDQYLCR